MDMVWSGIVSNQCSLLHHKSVCIFDPNVLAPGIRALLPRERSLQS
jgi:hypothetical protein